MTTRAARKRAHAKPRSPARRLAGPMGLVPSPPEGLLPSLARHQTLEELAYRDIRRAIMAGRLAPGERIVVTAIAAAAGISRIPVMQALRRLESEGFVRITPHKDVVVTSLSADEFRERFLMMASLEALCLREARDRITPETVGRLRGLQKEMAASRTAGDAARGVAADSQFHRLLWEASGLRQVVQTLQNVWDRGEYYRVIMHARRGGFARESLAEHELILRALEARDYEQAAHAIEHHRMHAMGRLAHTT
jgi:DNA-binding GntR family transcriptional regulator